MLCNVTIPTRIRMISNHCTLNEHILLKITLFTEISPSTSFLRDILYSNQRRVLLSKGSISFCFSDLISIVNLFKKNCRNNFHLEISSKFDKQLQRISK